MVATTSCWTVLAALASSMRGATIQCPNKLATEIPTNEKGTKKSTAEIDHQNDHGIHHRIDDGIDH